MNNKEIQYYRPYVLYLFDIVLFRHEVEVQTVSSSARTLATSIT